MQPSYSWNGRNLPGAVIHHYREQNRIPGSAILSPGFLSIWKIGDPLLGEDPLQFSVIAVSIFPFDGNRTKMGGTLWNIIFSGIYGLRIYVWFWFTAAIAEIRIKCR